MARTHSENTHQIPVGGVPSADSDYRSMLAQLESFLMEGTSIVPVFTKVGFIAIIPFLVAVYHVLNDCVHTLDY